MNERGLYQKYIVSKTNGHPLAQTFECIVLRIDGGRYVDACRAGVAAFAEAVRPLNKTLSRDIKKRLNELEYAEELNKAQGGGTSGKEEKDG